MMPAMKLVATIRARNGVPFSIATRLSEANKFIDVQGMTLEESLRSIGGL